MPLLSQEALPSEPADGTYTLLIPIELPPRARIKGDAEGEIGGRYVWVRNRGDGRVHVVVRGFESEDAARTGWEEVRAWLMWASCELGHGLRWWDEEPIQWCDVPPPDGARLGGATGFANRGTVIYPAGKRVAMVWAGRINPVAQFTADRLLNFISQAATLGVDSREDRVRLGFDLYRAAFWETSNYARFLTLVNAIEALKEQPDQHDGVQRLIDKWLGDVASAEAASVIDKDDANSLRTSLQHLRRRGIRASIKALVRDGLKDPNRAQEVVRIYDDRSSLVHEGIEPGSLVSHVAVLQQTVSLLLQRLLRQRT